MEAGSPIRRSLHEARYAIGYEMPTAKSSMRRARLSLRATCLQSSLAVNLERVGEAARVELENLIEDGSGLVEASSGPLSREATLRKFSGKGDLKL